MHKIMKHNNNKEKYNMKTSTLFYNCFSRTRSIEKFRLSHTQRTRKILVRNLFDYTEGQGSYSHKCCMLALYTLCLKKRAQL